MTISDLRVELDKPERTYRPGEAISGRVLVYPDSVTECEGLTVALVWATHGKGNRARQPEKAFHLFRGTWLSGEEASYPFSLTAPSGPPTYHGTILNLD